MQNRRFWKLLFAIIRDFEFHYVFPEGIDAMVFPEETCFIGYTKLSVAGPGTGHEDFSLENDNNTYEEIARNFKRDAASHKRIADKYQKIWRHALCQYRYSPATPRGTDNPHSRRGIGRGESYNGFNIICEDLYFPNIWEEMGRNY